MSEPNSIENKESLFKKGARVGGGFLKGRRAYKITRTTRYKYKMKYASV